MITTDSFVPHSTGLVLGAVPRPTAEIALAVVGACAIVACIQAGWVAMRLGRARRAAHGHTRRESVPSREAPRTQATADWQARRRRPVRVLGYASVEGQRTVRVRGGLKGQMEKIAAECERRGLSLLELVREREHRHASALERPGLGYALERISAGEAQGLVVAELSRLTRSLPDLGQLLGWLSRSNVRLVAAAEDLDTGEERGQLAAGILVEVSGWDRERSVERTREGMQVERRKGPPGVADYPELRDRIARMRVEGMSLRQIADRLNADGVPTVRGGAKWRPSSLQAVMGYRRPRAKRTGLPT
jgi:DNA invertase Pin-like site-specific DNA recombinase